ncbi:MAG: acetyl-CoA acetyltransferase [Gammaproteobacteria bacterium]|jgi:acetyl-CoA acyltransferase|nr:acetyl-CoA acetyltransferase [Gammaproteobacteria bacterium]
MNQPVYIVAAERTPVGKYRGAFRYTRPDTLLANLIHAFMAKQSSLDPAAINDVIIGCAMPEAEQGMNVARISTLLAGLPNTVPAMTVNRFCSSGIQTIALAADRIRTGEADVILAGGVESMTMVPMGGNKLSANIEYFSNGHENIAYSMGITAELVAEQWGITRQMQDEFALQSHQRALNAIQQGFFKDEIIAMETHASFPDLTTNTIREVSKLVSLDEGPRADSSLAALAKLPTVFKRNGTVTAGNASQMSDGAGIALIVSEKALKTFNLTPMARFAGFDVTGVPPEIMGIGPKEAIPLALKQANLRLDDMAWIELNEAFAAQSLAVIKDLNLDPAKVNPCGGAIALGHPLGATGAIRTATLLHGLKRTKQKYGMVTMCIGTGMGAAGIFENLS